MKHKTRYFLSVFLAVTMFISICSFQVSPVFASSDGYLDFNQITDKTLPFNYNGITSIGGGSGYSGIITGGTIEISAYDESNNLKTSEQLTSEIKNAVSSAQSGDTIFIDPDCVINLSESIVIDKPLTIASSRGYNGSEGAQLLASDTFPGWAYIFDIKSSNVRLSGLRLRGNKDRNLMAFCINAASFKDSQGNIVHLKGIEVDNCDISYFILALKLEETSDTNAQLTEDAFKIHHNYIHQNNLPNAISDYGYGITIGNAYPQIYANIFHNNRHDIAATGYEKNGYNAYCNIMLEGDSEQANFDMHANRIYNPDNTFTMTYKAGGFIHIHHNDIRDINPQANIYPVGRPNTLCLVDNNRFSASKIFGQGNTAIMQDCWGRTNSKEGYGNIVAVNNIYGGSEHTGWYVNETWDSTKTDNVTRTPSLNDLLMSDVDANLKGIWLDTTSQDLDYSFGDINGDHITDILKSEGGKWYYMPMNTSYADHWTEINTSDLKFGTMTAALGYSDYAYTPDLYFGDVDADGTTDVLQAAADNQWNVSYGAATPFSLYTGSGTSADWFMYGNFGGSSTQPTPAPVSYDFDSSHAGSTITIDGDLNEAGWNVSHELKQGIVEGTTNNAATFGTMWDNNNLYVAFDVADSNLATNMDEAPWNVDSAELYIDGNNSDIYDSHAAQFIFRWYDPATSTSEGNISIFGNTAATLEGVQYASKAKADGSGYTMEIAIPWANIGGLAVENGKTIGITAHINDCDNVDGALTYGCLGYTPNMDNDWQDAAYWADMSLSYDFSSAHADNSVTVDGDLSEAGWDISHELVQGRSLTTNNIANFGTMWDANNLYVAFDVTDSNLVANMDEAPWNVDSAELYIDGNNSDIYDSHAAQFIFRWYDPATSTSEGNISIFGNTSATLDGIQYAAKVKADGSGYIMEIAIPWANIGGLTAESGKNIGITAHINDCDDVNGTLTYDCLGYTVFYDNDWQDAAYWANMTLAPGAPAPTPAPFDFSSTHADSSVTVNGDLNEAGWDVSHELTQGKKASSNTAKFGTMWDANNLYVAFDVTDSSLISNPDAYPWDVDSAELYIDGNNSDTYDSNAAQFIFRWFDPAASKSTENITIFGNSAVKPEGIQYAAKAKADGSGYIMEIAIPWSNIGGLKAESGKDIGITAHINDCDDVNGTLSYDCLGYTIFYDNDWQDAAYWADMTLTAPVSFDFDSNYADNAVTVDGDLSETGWNVVHELVQGKVDGVSNNIANFGTMWDTKNLYVAFDVTDSSLVSNLDAYPWDVDSAELYIDGDNTDAYDAHAAQFIFRWFDPAVSTSTENITIFGNSAVKPDGIQYASKAKADGSGYTMEIAIPWTNIGGLGVESGKNIGITAHINDCDDNSGTLAYNCLGYTVFFDNDWQDAAYWADMTLAPGSPLPTPTEAPVIITTPVTTVTPTPTPNPADEHRFSDITGHWAIRAIMDMAKAGVLNGYGDGSARPDKNATRAEFTAFIAKLMKVESNAALDFNDINTSAWYMKYLSGAVEKGWINGRPDGSFAPNDLITREEAFAIISRIIDSLGVTATIDNSVLDSYKDKDSISAWVKNDVVTLVGLGIIEGSNGKLNPKGEITRAEICTILDRIMEKYLIK